MFNLPIVFNRGSPGIRGKGHTRAYPQAPGIEVQLSISAQKEKLAHLLSGDKESCAF